MKRTFIRNKRTTADCFEPLNIKIEKQTSSGSHGLLQAFINIIVYLMIFLLFIKNNLQYMKLFIAFMVASLITQFIVRFWNSVRLERHFPFIKVVTNKKQYKNYLDNVTKTIQEYNNRYYLWSIDNYPDAQKTIQMIESLDYHLFMRLPTHRDFMSISLGTASVAYQINISYPSFSYNEYDPILNTFKEKADKIISNHEGKQLVFPFSFQQHKRLAITNDRVELDDFVEVLNNYIISLCSFHSPEELSLCFVYGDDIQLDWTRFLPHVWYEGRRLIYSEKESEAFYSIMQTALEKSNRKIIAFVDADYLINNSQLLSFFNKDNLHPGLGVVFYSFGGIKPSRTDVSIECKESVGNKVLAVCGNTTIYVDKLPSDTSDELARKLFNIKIIDNESTLERTIPDKITLFELYKIKNASQMPKADISESVQIQYHFPIKVGVDYQGNDVFLDFTNDGDGNHCLVTGTNGSGKSEFILSYVIAACSKYSPDYLSFVVIDFKNGAMSSFINNLPHCLGEFINDSELVSKRELTRIALLLKSEIDRRFAILKRSDCDGNLAKYHEMYASGIVKEPLPRLLVIVDEVAVFFSTDDKAKDYIKHIATVGRQAGMILLLATQSKSGVIPSQVRTNINIQVEFYSEDEGSKVASKIKGRATVNSLKKRDCICQMTYSSTHFGNNSTIDFMTITGNSRVFSEYSKSTQFDKVLNEICCVRYSHTYNLGEVLTDTLETYQESSANYYLSDLSPIYHKEYPNLSSQFIIGIVDDLYRQKRSPLTYNLGEYNLMIWGNPQSGKTTMIMTILYAICNRTSGMKPNQLNVYIVAKNKNEYEAFTYPQIGSILESSELFYFLLFFYNEIHRRSQNTEDNYIPIVGIIDDCFDRIRNNDELAKMLEYITHESVRYNIFLVVSASEKPAFGTGHSLLKNFRKVAALFMGLHYDYSSIIDLNEIKTIPDYKGRCLINLCGDLETTLEAQIALPYKESILEIAYEAKHYNDLWISKPAPIKIPVMPSRVSCSIDENKAEIPIGVSKDLHVVTWDLLRINTFLISYFNEDDAYSFMRYIVTAFKALGYTIYTVDNQKTSLSATIKDSTRYFQYNQQNDLLNELQKIDETHSDRIVLIICDYNRFLFPSLKEEIELVKLIDHLIKNNIIYGVFSEFRDYINASRQSGTYFTQYLEGQSNGLLLGKTPENHPFGASSLSAIEKMRPLDIGWGINVSNQSQNNKLVKFATELKVI